MNTVKDLSNPEYTKIIKNIIENSETVLITGHVNPDGDCVGSCFAFAEAVYLLGKRPIILLSEFSDKFNFLAGKRFLYKGDISNLKCDSHFSLDTSVKDRIGDFEKLFDDAKITVNIDHHISNTLFAQNNFVAEASSTSEYIYWLLKDIIKPNRNFYEAVYAGMLTDSGGFRFNSTTPSTHIAAAEIISYIDFSKITRDVMQTHTESEARALSAVIHNMKTAENGKLIYSVLSYEDMKNCGAASTDLNGIVEYLLNTKNAEISVFLREEEKGTVKISFRSVKQDVNKIAAVFGGGGHINASGATIKNGGIDNAVKNVIDEVIKNLHD